MVAKRFGLAVVVAVTILAMAPLSYGQGLGMFGGANGTNSAWCGPGAQGFWMALGARKYINSFTSYEFPNPGGGADPLSRLEFPWEQVYGVAKVGWAFQSFELKLEFAGTALTPSFLKMQDSDWEDPNNTHQKTTFSSSKAKPTGWMLDVSTTIPCPSFVGCGSALRGIIGYRTQSLRFTPSDGTQWSIWDSATGTYVPRYAIALPGVAIEFAQSFKHFYFGGVAEFAFDPSQYMSSCSTSLLPCAVIRLQADYSYVTANNQDDHVLRGDRHTYERTTGGAWHLNGLIGFYAGCEKTLRLDVEADFMRIKTTGNHELADGTGGWYFGWKGADVWSDQAYVGISGKYFFSSACGF